MAAAPIPPIDRPVIVTRDRSIGYSFSIAAITSSTSSSPISRYIELPKASGVTTKAS